MLPKLRFITQIEKLFMVLWAVGILAPAGSSTAAAEEKSGTFASVGDAVPTGFGVERYARLWERNPFTLESPATPQTRRTVFDDLFLNSWMNEGGKELVIVQNSQTGELQRVAARPNQNNLRLLGIHKNPNPQLVEAVIAQGREEGTVRFRFDLPVADAGTNSPGSPNKRPVVQPTSPAATNAEPPANHSNAQPTSNQGVGNNLVYPGMTRVRSEGASPQQPGIRSRFKFRVDPVPKSSAAPPQ
jgi:hypothetical protein